MLDAVTAKRACVTAVVVALASGANASADDLPGYADRASFPYFATPSGRIACSYATRPPYRIDCTDYSGSTAGQNMWTVRPRGRARKTVIRGNAPSEDLPRARYGRTYRYRGITCRVHRTRGITCRNRDGHGFSVAVQRKRVF